MRLTTVNDTIQDQNMKISYNIIYMKSWKFIVHEIILGTFQNKVLNESNTLPVAQEKSLTFHKQQCSLRNYNSDVVFAVQSMDWWTYRHKIVLHIGTSKLRSLWITSTQIIDIDTKDFE